MAIKYVVKQTPVEAMDWDGTPARAHEILGWLFRNNSSGTYDQKKNILQVTNRNKTDLTVDDTSWVVLMGNSDVMLLSANDFAQKFEVYRG